MSWEIKISDGSFLEHPQITKEMNLENLELFDDLNKKKTISRWLGY